MLEPVSNVSNVFYVDLENSNLEEVAKKSSKKRIAKYETKTPPSVPNVPGAIGDFPK